MNTEKFNALKQVRETLNTITAKLPDLPANSVERDKLEDANAELEALVWQIIHEDIVAINDQLQGSAFKLKEISEKLKDKNDDLNEICMKIENASKVVKAIADIASIAGNAGIL
jgi:seryl-tRNA synthetase